MEIIWCYSKGLCSVTSLCDQCVKQSCLLPALSAEASCVLSCQLQFPLALATQSCVATDTGCSNSIRVHMLVVGITSKQCLSFTPTSLAVCLLTHLTTTARATSVSACKLWRFARCSHDRPAQFHCLHASIFLCKAMSAAHALHACRALRNRRNLVWCSSMLFTKQLF